MRTTLEIDDDVLAAAKELAQIQGRTAGAVLSDLARKALEPVAAPKVRNGVTLFQRKPGSLVPSMDLVNRLRDDDE